MPWRQCSAVPGSSPCWGYTDSEMWELLKVLWGLSPVSRPVASCNIAQRPHILRPHHLSSASLPSLPLGETGGTFLFVEFAQPVSTSGPLHLLTLWLELSSFKSSRGLLFFLRNQHRCDLLWETLTTSSNEVSLPQVPLVHDFLSFPSLHLWWFLIIFSTGWLVGLPGVVCFPSSEGKLCEAGVLTVRSLLYS